MQRQRAYVVTFTTSIKLNSQLLLTEKPPRALSTLGEPRLSDWPSILDRIKALLFAYVDGIELKLAVALVVGFCLGYSIRSFVSYRRKLKRLRSRWRPGYR